jgi:hypothetical protein
MDANSPYYSGGYSNPGTSRYYNNGWYYDYYHPGAPYQQYSTNQAYNGANQQYPEFQTNRFYSGMNPNAPGWETGAYPYSQGYQGSGYRGQYTRGYNTDMYQGNYGQGYAGAQQVSGEILRTKRIPVRGTNQQMLAALIETNSGQRLVVDLGPTQQLSNQDIHLHQGDQISARGRFLDIGEHHVLMANRLRINGETVAIQRTRQQPSQRVLQREEQFWNQARSQNGNGMNYAETAQETDEQFTPRSSNYQNQQDENDQFDQQQGQFSRQNRFQRGQWGQQGQQWSAERGEQWFNAPMRVSGVILRTKNVQLPGMSDQIVFATVRTDQGRRCVVNLGPLEELENLQLHRGERISVLGPTMQIGNQRLILAQRLRAQGETVQLNQEVQENSSPRAQRISGQIIRTQEVQLPGLNDEILIALVKTNNGQQVLVNLGDASELEDQVQLHRGDRISVRGRAFQMHGQSVVLAQQVRANGETFQIGQSASQAQQQQFGQPSSRSGYSPSEESQRD